MSLDIVNKFLKDCFAWGIYYFSQALFGLVILYVFGFLFIGASIVEGLNWAYTRLNKEVPSR